MLAEPPFAFQLDHLSTSAGPRIVGTSHQFGVPAGTLWLSFRDRSPFAGPALQAKIEQAMDGARAPSLLETIVLNDTVPALDPQSTLRRLRDGAKPD